MNQIKEETLNLLINYLIQQPFKDVAGLIQAIQTDLQTEDKASVDADK